MRILVTGGGGFIGHHLVKALLQKGCNVTVLEVDEKKLPKETSPKLKVVLGSMEDEEKVRQSMENVDIVYHLAFGYFGEFCRSFNINIKGTLNLLDAAVSQKVSQFLFASSETVYGRQRYVPINEEHPCNPDESLYLDEKMYPLIKFVTEKLCMIYHNLFRLPVTIFRLTGVYSKNSSNLIKWLGLDLMLEKSLKGETIVVTKGGGWEYIHIDDVIEAFLLAMLNKKSYGQVINVSNPNVFILDYEVAKLVVDITNSKSRIRQRFDPKECIGRFDINKAKTLLGFEPKVGKEFIEERIKKYIQENIKKDDGCRHK